MTLNTNNHVDKLTSQENASRLILKPLTLNFLSPIYLTFPSLKMPFSQVGEERLCNHGEQIMPSSNTVLKYAICSFAKEPKIRCLFLDESSQTCSTFTVQKNFIRIHLFPLSAFSFLRLPFSHRKQKTKQIFHLLTLCITIAPMTPATNQHALKNGGLRVSHFRMQSYTPLQSERQRQT